MANSSRSERQADRKSGQSARTNSPNGLFASALMRPKLDEALAKQIAEQRTEDWLMRLSEAFADGRRYKKSLALAEAAVASCPDTIVLELFAVNAALFEGKVEHAQALLKRFDSRGTAPAAELLRAIAQHMGGRTSSAKYTLERAKLTEWQDLYRAFPGGFKRIRWLQDHVGAILHGRPARPSRTAAVAKPVAANNSTPKRVPAAKPVMAPKIDDVKVASELPDDTAKTALTSLPMIDVALSFSLKFDSAPLLSALPLILNGKRQGSGTEGGFNSGDSARWFNLRERLNHLSLVQGFDELLCESQLVGLQPLWHQIETVRKVLRQFHGRVLLADEVGLGKTIEACMVLKEYAMRGMAERALILTPASLVGQWREELDTKFGLQFATTYDPLSRDDPAVFWAQKHVVASIATARRREHADHLAANSYDIVIVDEAHHLKDRTSQSWKLVDALNKRFLLLLSATPVQNDLVELYNLLTLLKPGIFKTPKEFRLAHITPGKPRVPANPEALRTLMRDAMIRNTRAVVALKLPRRQASTLKVDGAPGETAAYAALTEAARVLAAKEGAGRKRLTLHHLLTAAGSSPRAALAAVSRMAEREPKSKVLIC
jgi:SNF2-related domain